MTTMSVRKAIFWSILWIVLSLLMNVGIYFAFGEQKALEFFTGYVIEKSLSVDNLFVFLLIFTYFKVQPVHQRRVLNFGIIGVVILRGLLILLGTALVKEFHWVMYIFGGIILYSGYRITFGEEKKIELENNIVLKVFRKFIPVSKGQNDGRFFYREKGVLYATSLFVVLLIIETTDVVFAVDSIPAIFAITTDPLIVFSSNMMAVLGLRSMYFVLEQGQQKFEYMKYGVGVVLAYVGVKMLLMDVVTIHLVISLLIIASILGISVLLSYVVKTKRFVSS
ncbi:MAG: TerC/Alx family metal homeostasis membrane protein [Bacteroidota bacterium]